MCRALAVASVLIRGTDRGRARILTPQRQTLVGAVRSVVRREEVMSWSAAAERFGDPVHRGWGPGFGGYRRSSGTVRFIRSNNDIMVRVFPLACLTARLVSG